MSKEENIKESTEQETLDSEVLSSSEVEHVKEMLNSQVQEEINTPQEEPIPEQPQIPVGDISVAMNLALPLLQWCVENKLWFGGGFYVSEEGVVLINQNYLIKKEEELPPESLPQEDIQPQEPIQGEQ